MLMYRTLLARALVSVVRPGFHNIKYLITFNDTDDLRSGPRESFFTRLKDLLKTYDSFLPNRQLGVIGSCRLPHSQQPHLGSRPQPHDSRLTARPVELSAEPLWYDSATARYEVGQCTVRRNKPGLRDRHYDCTLSSSATHTHSNHTCPLLARASVRYGRSNQWRFLRFVNPADRAGRHGRRHGNGDGSWRELDRVADWARRRTGLHLLDTGGLI